MQLDLDNYFKETSERLFNRLVRAYSIRILNANDIEYSHQQYVKFCEANLGFWIHLSDIEPFLDDLEHNYKLGNKFNVIIKKVLRNLTEEKIENMVRIIEDKNETEEIYSEIELISADALETENSSGLILEKIDSEKNKIQYSGKDVVRIFAKYKAYQRFSEFLSSQKLTENAKIEMPEFSEKSKDFTTARQVLAVHYLLKYAQVKNVDKTEIARFIQFLTGKNYDNIYKKLQNPFKINDKYLKEDLRFIRDYFERLDMSEVVKMINGEMG